MGMRMRMRVVFLLAVMATTIAARFHRNSPAPRKRLKSKHVSFWRDRSQQFSPSSGEATLVTLGIYINSFYAIDEKDMDYSLSIYLRQAWHDPTLAFPDDVNTTSKLLQGGARRAIWLPDTFIRNERESSFHYVTVPNMSFRLNATGHVTYSTRISATLSCTMDLKKYPFDRQECSMLLESFKYTSDVLRFAWRESPVEVDPSVQLPQFTLQKVELHDCSQTYISGVYPCHEIRFFLQRDIGFFILQFYLPNAMLVTLSWFALWIDMDGMTARVVLGIIIVLSQTALNSCVMTSLPRVSYVKAIDIWVCACSVFVFATLLEFAVIEALITNRKPKVKDGRVETHTETTKRLRDKVDSVAKIVFPVGFLIFNMIYWAEYLASRLIPLS